MNKFIKEKSLYYSALQGNHPDLSAKKKWIRHESESINRAVTLYLRDIFTPLSQKFHKFVLQVSSAKIIQMFSQFEIYKNVYHDAIFNEKMQPFLEGYSCPIEYKDAKYVDFLQAYQNLPPAVRSYYHQLLLHTKSVATLERYGLSDIVTGSYHSYLWSPIDGLVLTTSQAVDTTLVPIGEYGRSFAEAMLLTANIMAKLSQQFFEKNDIAQKYQQIIDNETARGREKQQAVLQSQQMCHWQKDLFSKCEHAQKIYQLHNEQRQLTIKESQRFPAPDTFKEAIQSVQAAISSFFAQKVPGYSNPLDLLKKVVSSGVAIQFAKIVPFGYTLPVVRRGRYFPNIIQQKKNNLQLNSDFCKNARYLKEEYLKMRVYESNQRNPGFLGFGCPAAIHNKECKKTGIRYILECYQHLLGVVLENK
ncbi:hypothetical protein [Candidatus Uabimicrobium sp. HlEnr_7]|uniref:hypothetical protein n=1 Tax=Candidatus Uabimicrobium helgolandensis TaxID=3095367 RepID=UPI003558098B